MSLLVEETVCLLDRVRKRKPLVHNITNFVVMNSSANVLLAQGASPVMAHSIDEVVDMVALANALVLNIGTLERDWVASMIAAGKAANERGIPVILDPVGAGATPYRTATAHRLLQEVRVAVLRGNASEVLSLRSSEAQTKGVDSLHEVEDVQEAAAELARELHLVVGISGKVDCITDGQRSFRVANGHPLMPMVTGLGCGLTATVGAFCAVSEEALVATTAAFAFYGLAGEVAARTAWAPGSFQVAFLDALYTLGEADLRSGLKIAEGNGHARL